MYSRTELLIGKDGVEKLRRSSVVVAGVGGVGAYAVEMLVRAGVGRVVIVDSDQVHRSNLNRQLLALESTMGCRKVDVMQRRAKDVNPDTEIVPVYEYINEDNVGEIIGAAGKIDFLVDAIDTLSPKLALISYCFKNSIPLISSMGAGAKMDATKVRIADISKSYNCPLAYIVRKKLRKLGIYKGFPVVFSEELPDTGAIVPCEERNKKSMTGTISYLPAVFGCVAAQGAIEYLLGFQNGQGQGRGVASDGRILD